MPSAAFCCLGLLLFTIASTIVIALIPVYLPYRNGGQARSIQGPLQQFNYSLPSVTTYPIGPLTQVQLAYLVEHVIESIHEGYVHFISF